MLGARGGVGKKWMDFGCVLEQEQPRLSDGWFLGGKEVEESSMTQLLGLSNSFCCFSNMLGFPFFFFFLIFSLILLAFKIKGSQNFSQGYGIPKSRLNQPTLQSTLT